MLKYSFALKDTKDILWECTLWEYTYESLFFFILITTLVSGCGPSHPHLDRPLAKSSCLYGGTPVVGQECGRQSLFSEDPFPFVGNLILLPKDTESISTSELSSKTFSPESFCTATLLSPSIILTAKHCLLAALKETPFTRIGFLLHNSHVLRLQNFYIPNHDPNFHSETNVSNIISSSIDFEYFPDLALIEIHPESLEDQKYRHLLTNMTYPQLYAGLPFLGLTDDLESFQKHPPLFYVIGMGTHQHHHRRPVAHKKMYYHPSFQSYEHQEMIFSQKGEQTCPGDSGGPLMIQHDQKWILVGVTARGSQGCGGGGPSGRYDSTFQFIGPWTSIIQSFL